MALCFAMVAGEASGDILGAGLIKALKQRYPDARFIGIGGPKMIAQGFETLYPMERLSIMGLVEVLGRLPELLRMRKALFKQLMALSPDVFIGIDAPDFNLGLERKFKNKGIKSIHYVSPSVWAWREKRVFKIRKSVDKVLCLFPFEVDFYAKYDVPAVCVGHTLADEIPMEPDTYAAREALELDQTRPVVAILPGSRQGEVAKLGALFLQTAELMRRHKPDLQFVIPAASIERKRQLQELLAPFENLRVKLVSGESTQVMTAADAVLMASGTASLEGMLLKKPLVVSYKVSPITAFILRRLLTQKFVSLPNLLAGKQCVPEILQEQATPENLAEAMMTFVQDPHASKKLKDKFSELHLLLRRDADNAAADAVMASINSDSGLATSA